MMMNLPETRKLINECLNDLMAVDKQLQNEEATLIIAESYAVQITKAQEITQAVAQKIQQQAHDRIVGVVCKCLEMVFGDVYQFNIHFERKRGRTEAKLVLMKDGHEIDDPMDEDSGGVVDVAAFALRLSCLVLAKPYLRRLIVLDEPFKFVSAEYRDNVRMMLEGLAKDFKIQFIMVTHEKEYETGKVIEL